MRMLELPTNKMAFFGGGFVLSLASKARISLSKALVRFCACVVKTANAATKRRSEKRMRHHNGVGPSLKAEFTSRKLARTPGKLTSDFSEHLEAVETACEGVELVK